MGNIVARARFHVTRPVREYNLENSAYKAIEKNKYIPSPRHPSTSSLIEQSIESLSPEAREQLENPNAGLDSHLRRVFVTSRDVLPEQPVSSNSPERPLPLNRSPVRPSIFGYYDPKTVPYGKVKLKDVLEFITLYRENPDEHTPEKIANKYKLDLQLTEQVLKYFGMFRLLVPADTTEKQEKMLKRLKATPDYLPNTAQLQLTLLGVPVVGKPGINEPEGKLPLTQIKEVVVDKSHEVTLLNYKLKVPLSGGRQEGDEYFDKKSKSPASGETGSGKAEAIEDIPIRPVHKRPTDTQTLPNEAQSVGRKKMVSIAGEEEGAREFML